MKQNLNQINRQLIISIKSQLKDFKGDIGLVIICLLLAKVATFGIPFLLKQIIDELSPQRLDSGYVIFVLPVSLIVAYGLLNISHIFFKDLKDYLSAKIIQSVIRAIGQNIFLHLNSLSLHFHVSK